MKQSVLSLIGFVAIAIGLAVLVMLIPISFSAYDSYQIYTKCLNTGKIPATWTSASIREAIDSGVIEFKHFRQGNMSIMISLFAIYGYLGICSIFHGWIKRGVSFLLILSVLFIVSFQLVESSYKSLLKCRSSLQAAEFFTSGELTGGVEGARNKARQLFLATLESRRFGYLFVFVDMLFVSCCISYSVFWLFSYRRALISPASGEQVTIH